MRDGITVIDSHAHFIPSGAAESARTGDGTDYRATLADRAAETGVRERALDIEGRIEFMDEAGLDVTVLNMSSWSPQGLEVCRALNDGYAEVVGRHPHRFVGCAHVPLDGRREVIQEVKRAIGTLGLRAVSLVSSTSDRSIDAEDIFPLYERISELDVPVVLHPTTRMGLWGGTRYKMSNHVSREYDVIKATVEIMFGVLPRFPDLRFLIPHFGGGMPALKGRIMAFYEPEGVFIPEHLKNVPKTQRQLRELGIDKAFGEVFDKLYFDTAGHLGWPPITRAATETIRLDRLCFGTDYPFEIREARDVADFIDSVCAMDISEVDKRNILGGNVKQLFKLD